MQIPIPSRISVYEGSRNWPLTYDAATLGFIYQKPLETSAQLGLPFYGKFIDVDGLKDPKYGDGIRYMGKATHVFDNVYRCLAVVAGAICVVEVTVSPLLVDGAQAGG